jgi:3D (Asp-Asp-Asp) domain-containing protein
MRILGTLFLLLTVAAPARADHANLAYSEYEDAPVIGKFRDTYYYSVRESDFAAGTDAALLDLQGGTLALVSAAYKKAIDIEGTGRLRDGRVLNFAARVDGTIRYHVTTHPFGHGAGDCALIPFHTIAVDPRKIPLGSVVRIDETVGMELPDGTRHDGTWRAEDIGSAIQEDRIDLFVGEGDQGATLDHAHIGNLQPLTVRLLQGPPANSCSQPGKRI